MGARRVSEESGPDGGSFGWVERNRERVRPESDHVRSAAATISSSAKSEDVGRLQVRPLESKVPARFEGGYVESCSSFSGENVRVFRIPQPFSDASPLRLWGLPVFHSARLFRQKFSVLS